MGPAAAIEGARLLEREEVLDGLRRALGDARAGRGRLVLVAGEARVTLDGAQRGCVSYDAASDSFQSELKTPKTLAPGNHTVGIRVSAPDGSGVLNTDSTTVIIKR